MMQQRGIYLFPVTILLETTLLYNKNLDKKIFLNIHLDNINIDSLN